MILVITTENLAHFVILYPYFKNIHTLNLSDVLKKVFPILNKIFLIVWKYILYLSDKYVNNWVVHISKGSSEYIKYLHSYMNFVSKSYTTYLEWLTQYINRLDLKILFLKWALFTSEVSFPGRSKYIFLECIFRLKCLFMINE